jgi:N-acetylneuraminate synthase
MWNKRRISPVSGRDVSYIEYKREIEFGENEYAAIDEMIPGRWFVSVWDAPSVYFITSNFPDAPYLKIPSAHLTSAELIDECVLTDIPLIMSTGMSTSKEILSAVERVPRGYPLTLLACVSSYPCWDDEIHLNKINILRSIFAYREEIEFGYSNHSPSSYPSIYAGLLGAEMIEIHVTLNRALPGSDHAASLEMRAVELVLRELKRLPELFGPNEITVFPGELEKRKSLRGV